MFLPRNQAQFWLICQWRKNSVPKSCVSVHHMAGFWALEQFTEKTE